MELLAPAGTRENFMAALEVGADAIYLGGKVFNARAKAGNFEIDELEECVRIAHLLGVAVFVTVNILIGDKELPQLEAYIRDLDRIHVDAVIVQDIATARIVRRVSKRLAIHGSTQMTAANLGTVNYLYDLGFSRVVLSRELSLREIEYICANTKAEIEVFIHGALCICYSGQCLMSSMIGGRSGNRGACAQPCRLPYELLNEEGKSLLPRDDAYIMSPKDLNYAAHMDALIEAGVASFKVEGRMKKASYVREVIGAYRSIIDKNGKASTSDLKQLESGFNRGFSTNYLLEKTGRSMMTIAAPNNQGKEIGRTLVKGNQLKIITQEELQIGDLLKVITKTNDVRYYTIDENWKRKEGHLLCEPEEVPVEGTAYLVSSKASEERREISYMTRKWSLYAYLDGKEGEPVSLTVMVDNGMTAKATDTYCLQRALNKATSIEKIGEQLGRLGNTLFRLDHLSAPEGEWMWPASVLNNLRRKAVEALERELLVRYEEDHRPLVPHCRLDEIDEEGLQEIKPLSHKLRDSYKGAFLSVRVDELEGVKAAIAGGAHIIHFGGDRLCRIPYDKAIYKEVSRLCKEAQVALSFVTPRVVRAHEEEDYMETLKAMVEAQPDAINIHCLGALQWLKDLSYKGSIWADTSLNIFNSETIDFLRREGVSLMALSEEVTLEQIRQMAKQAPEDIFLEGLVQGETELMVSEYCVINAFMGGGTKKNCTRPCLKDSYYLKDRKGEIFPLRTDPYCRMHIMNGHDLDMKPYTMDLVKKGLSLLRIEGRQRQGEWIKNTLLMYKDILLGEKVVAAKSGEQITRGHYFKGIF